MHLCRILKRFLLGIAFFAGLLILTNANAATVRFSDYYAPGNIGDTRTYVDLQDNSFTWRVEAITTGDNAGRIRFGNDTTGYGIYTVSNGIFTMYEAYGMVLDTPVALPEFVDTDQEFMFIDTPAICLTASSITVPAGTFNDVIVMAALDENYTPNLMNTFLGLGSLTTYAVTDISWFAKGFGEVKYYGVAAATGNNDGSGYELTSYSSVPVPATLWLIVPGLAALLGIRRKAG